ncbi:MAG: hypothetical protein KME10_11730 [Plectolyngbya sp. WJT66-NPBG17]|nr:hypothetical protein [Plectolyngbya sp. WJT66-NPBG17]
MTTGKQRRRSHCLENNCDRLTPNQIKGFSIMAKPQWTVSIAAVALGFAIAFGFNFRSDSRSQGTIDRPLITDFDAKR